MKSLILHIGPHKTGSSTIQHFLAINEVALREQYGINYVKAGRKYPRPNRNLAFEIAKLKNYLPERTGWNEAVVEIDDEGFDRHIISSEAFSHFDAEHVDRLHDLIGKHKVTVVYYTRRPDGWVESSYVQQLKTLTTQYGPQQFFESKLAESQIVRPASLLAMWAARFGDDAIRLRVLEGDQLVGGDLVTDFCDAADLDPAGLNRTVEVRNPAPGAKTVDALYHVSTTRKADDPRAPMSGPVGDLAKKVRKYGKAQGWDEERAKMMPGDLAITICDRFADEQAEAARRFLGRADGVLFRERPEAGGGMAATLPGRLTEAERDELMTQLKMR